MPLVISCSSLPSFLKKAIILKCSSNCWWNRFKIVINLVMYLIEDYYNIPLMHAQYFSDSFSDPQWWMCMQRGVFLHFMFYRHYSLILESKNTHYSHDKETRKKEHELAACHFEGLSRTVWKLKLICTLVELSFAQNDISGNKMAAHVHKPVCARKSKHFWIQAHNETCS